MRTMSSILMLAVAMLGIIIGIIGCDDHKEGCPSPELSYCKEGVELIEPVNNIVANCGYDGQTIEVLDKPMPGAKHAYWLVKCACPKTTNQHGN